MCVESHLELRKPGIEKVKWICEQCLEHDRSWWEFEARVSDTLIEETKRMRDLR